MQKIKAMAILDYIQRINRIDNLIRLKATGTAKELADKIGVSRRMVYNYIETMKELGAPIEYDSAKQTFYYSDNGKFYLGYLKIKGSLLSGAEIKRRYLFT